MQKEWIDTTEACFLTTKSPATIKRYISANKNNSKTIKKQNVNTFINSDLLRERYPFINEPHISPNDTYEQSKEIASLTLEKQNRDIIKELIQQKEDKKTPILRHSTFWTAVVSIIIIVCIGVGGYYYKKEIMENNNSKINDLKQNYTAQIEFQKKEIANQQERYKEQEKQYSIVISEVKSSNLKLAAVQDKQITELASKLKELNKGLKEAETAHTMALKNTDVLHVKYNDKIGQLEDKIKGLEQGSKADLKKENK